MRNHSEMKASLIGVNASVVGILISALYHPILTSSILINNRFFLSCDFIAYVIFWKLPPWVIFMAGALGGILGGMLITLF